jgi:replicative DNA helicase
MMKNETQQGRCKASPSLPCSACSAWREKWLSTRRYLRAANRGAETNALALQLSAVRLHKLADQLQDLRINRQLLQAENRELKRALHDAISRPKGVVPESAEKFYQPNV